MLTDAEQGCEIDEICMSGCSNVMLVKYQHSPSHNRKYYTLPTCPGGRIFKLDVIEKN